MGVFRACASVHHLHACLVLVEARREHWILSEAGFQMTVSHPVDAVLESRFPRKMAVLLGSEPALQPHLGSSFHTARPLIAHHTPGLFLDPMETDINCIAGPCLDEMCN